MTGINKLIEEEAERYADKEVDDNVSGRLHRGEYYVWDLRSAIKDAYIDAIKNILHQNRWRTVEEELPEDNETLTLAFT